MLPISAFILLISCATVFAESKSPCDDGTYPDYNGQICMKVLNVSAPYRFASRFCEIYGFETLKLKTDDQEYVIELITQIVKHNNEFWINDNSTVLGSSSSCSFISSTSKDIQKADCKQLKSIICMRSAYTHYLYNLAFLDADMKSVKETLRSLATNRNELCQNLEEKMKEIFESQKTIKLQLNEIVKAMQNEKHEHGYVGNAENGFTKERRSKDTDRCAVPPQIIRSPLNETITAKEGSEVRLKCESTGNPQPIVQWYTKSTHVSKIGVEYPLQYISRGDAGEYTCVADNKIGLPVKETFTVVVLFRPICTSSASTINENIGQSVTLTCKVEADPKPEVHWYKDQMIGELESNTTQIKNQIYESNLTVRINSDHDFGTYRCVAINYVGQSSLQIQVIGSKPNVVINKRIDEVFIDHRSFRIESKIRSDSPVKECQMLIGSINELPTTVPMKFLQLQRSAGNKFYETIKSEELNFKFSPNTNYSIQMRCENKNGWSDYSNILHIVTYTVCGHDLTINENQCHYLTSHPEYGKLPYISSYKCVSTIKANNCSNIRTSIIEADQALRQRCSLPRSGNYFSSIQIKEKNSERNSAFNYICKNGKHGIVSQSNQITLEINKLFPESMHGFKLCFKCENLKIN